MISLVFFCIVPDAPDIGHTHSKRGKVCHNVSDDQSATEKAVILLWADLQYILQSVKMSKICIIRKSRSYPKTSENVQEQRGNQRFLLDYSLHLYLIK